MLGRFVLAALSLAVGVQPVNAAVMKPVVLQPSTAWQLDYGEARCRIVRVFGEESEKTVLYFEQYSPSDQFDWVIAGPLVNRLNARHKFTIQFGPRQASYELKPKINLTVGNFGKAIGGDRFTDWSSEEDDEGGEESIEPVGLPNLSLEQGEGIDWIEVSRADRSYRLNTGNLAAVFEAMNTCMEDLVTHWGADPEILKTRKTKPEIVNLNEVLRLIQARYPVNAESHGAQADLHVRVMVEADGSVAKCHTEAITEAERFDNSACLVFLENGKFKPATDLQDRPVPSYYTVRVSYRMR